MSPSLCSRSLSVRRLLLPLVVLPILALTQRDSATHAQPRQVLALTKELINEGLKLIIDRPMPELYARLAVKNGEPEVEVKLRFTYPRVDSEYGAKELKEWRAVAESILEENKKLIQQQKTVQKLLEQQVKLFEYQRQRDEGVLRKQQYDVPADKLTVIIADFSSGNPAEGQELADEIAAHLRMLTKHGIGINVIVGEVKPGVTIRSEEMCQDMARHLPSPMDYVVIWGTMSPRTVGKYRPNFTCVRTNGTGHGASVTITVNLDPEYLPEPSDPIAYQRRCYERLIGVTCAAIPGMYAGHKAGREEPADLSKFYEFIGKDTVESTRLQEQVAPFLKWSAVRLKNPHLHRLTEVSSNSPYPNMIINTKDGSLMTLVVDDNGKPRAFVGEGGKKHYTYIDILETNSGQYTQFLNDKGKIFTEGGVDWIKLENDFSDIEIKDGKFYSNRRSTMSVMNVSWFGARAYCQWSGKELPTQQEWQAAAGAGPYPWGNTVPQLEEFVRRTNWFGGANAKDVSRIGCYDMAGNLAEWCEDWFEEKPLSKRVVCGGSFNDSKAGDFAVTKTRGVAQASHERWVGFRGVFRIATD
jgi:hypothetical protein